MRWLVRTFVMLPMTRSVLGVRVCGMFTVRAVIGIFDWCSANKSAAEHHLQTIGRSRPHESRGHDRTQDEQRQQPQYPASGWAGSHAREYIQARMPKICLFVLERVIECHVPLHRDLVRRDAPFEEVREFLDVLQFHEREWVLRLEAFGQSQRNQPLICDIL